MSYQSPIAPISEEEVMLALVAAGEDPDASRVSSVHALLAHKRFPKGFSSPFAHSVNGQWYLSGHAKDTAPSLAAYKKQVREAYGNLRGVKFAVAGVDYAYFVAVGRSLEPRALDQIPGPAERETFIRGAVDAACRLLDAGTTVMAEGDVHPVLELLSNENREVVEDAIAAGYAVEYSVNAVDLVRYSKGDKPVVEHGLRFWSGGDAFELEAGLSIPLAAARVADARAHLGLPAWQPTADVGAGAALVAAHSVEVPTRQTIRDALLASIITRDGESEYSYLDPKTERDFTVRRCELSDRSGKSTQECFYLDELIPNGRMVELNQTGSVKRAWDEPRVLEAEARVGPNGLMAALKKSGIDVSKLVEVGGSFTINSIYHDSLDHCADAIAQALEKNERYQCVRPLTHQETVRLERESAQSSHEFWEGQARSIAHANAVGHGLFKGCHLPSGRPLPEDTQKKILSFLNAPSTERWIDIRGMCVAGPTTLWQAWCAIDDSAPRSGSKGVPEPEVLRQAIRAAVESRQAQIDAKRETSNPSGLKVVSSSIVDADRGDDDLAPGL